MSAALHVRFSLLEGPGPQAPFPAVIADFPRPRWPQLPADWRGRLLADFLPPGLAAQLSLPLPDGRFVTLAAALAMAVQDLPGTSGLDFRTVSGEDGSCRILLGFHDAPAAILALQTAIEMAAAVFDHVDGRTVRSQKLLAKLERAATMMRMRQPDPLARALIRVARSRGIPVYPVAPGSRIWQFGEGRRAFHCFEAATHGDSLTGERLSSNKFMSNHVVVQLGFPGVRHGVVGTPAAAGKLADELGFPVVLKPLSRGKGIGVTADIRNHDDLAAAFEAAREASAGKVLVERHVAGDDHRMTVFGGRLAWVLRRLPARVTGDGRHTVAELVEAENRRRQASAMADIVASPIGIDEDALRCLSGQGMTPSTRPEAGAVVILSSIANVSRGGTCHDCTTDVHPDNREMAEAIARCFHLDSAGIDFMTDDISRSWRDGRCAVLEVNATPGFVSDEQVAALLEAKFPDGSDGRVCSIVLVGGTATLLARVMEIAARTGRCIGRTDGNETIIAGRQRCAGEATLPARVRSLLSDPACEVLVVGVQPDELIAHGFPVRRCDLAVLAAGTRLAAPLGALVRDCAGSVLDGVTEAAFEDSVAPAVSAVLERSSPS